ncbi:MAG: FliG C-terminal domain-containing protein [Bdellovibrionota bacterium]|nr:FliG C-terminal domain-containing protein [Bdellovibrionota bacterium]
MDFDNTGNVFINGRAQILEMFQYLTAEEQARLLKQIKPRNPQLAQELQETSISFNLLTELPEHTIEVVLRYVKAPILGVALKSVGVKAQRKILGVCERGYAEEAFKVMNTRLSNESRDVERACERIRSIMSALSKKKLIQL